ncbi:hypothetical protein HN385_04910 [archaeon]|nr:hypothetical protein [archaeon]MBT3451307.1 hypothetical protein [archaeon]MBT6869291.1 hypothetical protein [archaeon]MBT7381199.1 hypothetical protein [archaeon]
MLSSSVLGNVERDIFIIDSDGGVTYKNQYVMAIEYGYYYESMELPFPVDSNYTNLEFYDSYGEIEGDYSETNEYAIDLYHLTTEEIEYGEPYEIGYTVDLPDLTITRYRENYFFKHMYAFLDDYPIDVYVCVPGNALPYAQEYDSSLDEYDFYDYEFEIPTYIPEFEYDYSIETYSPYQSVDEQIESVDVCPNGYGEYELDENDIVEDYYLYYEFQINSEDDGLFTEDLGDITISGPIQHKELILNQLDGISNIVEPLEELDLETPLNYEIFFSSNNDDVFETEYALISYPNGNGFLQIDTITIDDEEFLKLNVASLIINSALINTYDEPSKMYDYWWHLGDVGAIAYDLMKESGLSTSEIDEELELSKELLSEHKFNHLDYLSESNIALYQTQQIESSCPGAINYINEITESLSNIEFDSLKELNNFLIYNLNDYCKEDLTNLFEELYLSNDDPMSYSLRIESLLESLELIEDYDFSEKTELEQEINDVISYFETGNIEDGINSLEEAEELYGEVESDILLIEEFERMKSELIDPIDVQRNDIAVLNEFRDKVDEATELFESGDFEEAVIKLEEVEEIYNSELLNIVHLLTTYSSIEEEYNELSTISKFPTSFLIEPKFDKVIQELNSGDISSTEEALQELGTFVINAKTNSIIFYGSMILIFIVICYIFFIKNKKK